MNPLLLLIFYSVCIIVASMLGGRLSILLRMTHLRTQLLMSGVGGLMLGIALLHLLPHAVDSLGVASYAGAGTLIGLIIMFLLIRLFHTHDHSGPDEHGNGEEHAGHTCDHGHHHDHQHAHNHSHDVVSASRGISWTGLFFGLLLHTLFDGVALATSVMAESQHHAWLGLGGLGTFLAVALHKPLDAFAITSVMKRQNWSTRHQSFVNFAFSLACPIGALTFYLGASQLLANSPILGWGLALSAGFFIGIALADLLPEVAFHDHDRGKLTTVFLLGIAIAFGIENLPGHQHVHSSDSPSHTHDHSQPDHDHSSHDHDPSTK